MTTFIYRLYLAINLKIFLVFFQAEEPGILNNVPFLGMKIFLCSVVKKMRKKLKCFFVVAGKLFHQERREQLLTLHVVCTLGMLSAGRFSCPKKCTTIYHEFLW
jgi:hypothetical protein